MLKTIAVVPVSESRMAQHDDLPGKAIFILKGDRDDEYAFSIDPEDMAVLAEQLAAAADRLMYPQ